MIKHASINDNLWKEYYYGEDAVVENKLADYEGRWNEIISSILETESLPDTEKRFGMFTFFHINCICSYIKTWKSNK